MHQAFRELPYPIFYRPLKQGEASPGETHDLSPISKSGFQSPLVIRAKLAAWRTQGRNLALLESVRDRLRCRVCTNQDERAKKPDYTGRENADGRNGLVCIDG
jgi:hypothetical protein